MTATPDLLAHIEAERADLADLLEQLTGEDLDRPSLCEGWTVRDVAAHVISYDRINPVLYVMLFLATGMSVNRTNNVLVRYWRHRNQAALVRAFQRAPRPRGTMRLLGRRIALLDVLVHQQDIRQPLGRPRQIPAERTEAVARILTRHRIGAGGAARARGLTFHATDSGWTVGDGPAVSGPAAAIVLALAGRPSALAELHGEGVVELTSRLEAEQ